MKRTILTAVMAVAAVVAFAGNPIKVIGGDKKFFKNAEGAMLLEISYAGATFDGKMPLTDKYRDIPEKTRISYDGFIEEFSDKNNKITFVKDASQAKYKMSIKITKIDEFVNVMGFIPGPCIRAWGTLTVTAIGSNDPLLVVDIDEVDGGSAPTTDRAFNDTFGELGKRIAKLK